MRDYRSDRKDHFFVVTPAPVAGLIVIGDRFVKVPANVWHVYDTRPGPGYRSLVFVHPAAFCCAQCGADITSAQAGLSRLRRDGAAIACKDCVTSELTSKGDR